MYEIGGAMSEAVARVARERSEQERETQRLTARRWHLSLWPLSPARSFGVAADDRVRRMRHRRSARSPQVSAYRRLRGPVQGPRRLLSNADFGQPTSL